LDSFDLLNDKIERRTAMNDLPTLDGNENVSGNESDASLLCGIGRPNHLQQVSKLGDCKPGKPCGS
jgi:hypothetical protein